MKDFLFAGGFMLLVVGGTFLGGAIAYGFEGQGLSFGIAAGVCLSLAVASFLAVHLKGGIDVCDDIFNLPEDSAETKN